MMTRAGHARPVNHRDFRRPCPPHNQAPPIHPNPDQPDDFSLCRGPDPHGSNTSTHNTAACPGKQTEPSRARPRDARPGRCRRARTNPRNARSHRRPSPAAPLARGRRCASRDGPGVGHGAAPVLDDAQAGVGESHPPGHSPGARDRLTLLVLECAMSMPAFRADTGSRAGLGESSDLDPSAFVMSCRPEGGYSAVRKTSGIRAGGSGSDTAV